ncbi:MAG: thrombospondin type 3 repeat-containing protein, partial [Muriicola sp.]|nr:thrombospondin type 3 repeat-containing protein [Muriicola sp.]
VPDLTISTITATPLSIVADGSSTSNILIQLFDANGNAITTGGESVVVSSTLGTVGNVTDLGNGSYSAILTSGTIAGTANLSFTINGNNALAETSVSFIPYDSDGDGVPDDIDNCPQTSNPTQEDFDGDGLGDVCDTDLDGDGVENTQDQCSNTPLGAIVDATGCEIFDLPLSNFNINVSSRSCVLTGDGAITIEVAETSFTYSISVTGMEPILFDARSAPYIVIEGLSAGSYDVCFSVVGVSGYEECFRVEIEERDPLSVEHSIDKDSRELTLRLSGANSYRVLINGEEEIVTTNEFTKVLPSGLHTVQVYTDWECQGSYMEKIFVPLRVTATPNPTDGRTQVYVPGTDQRVYIQIYSMEGQMLLNQQHELFDIRYTEIDLGGLSAGTYLIHVEGPSISQNFKIIKK